jgi:hypothetical protein
LQKGHDKEDDEVACHVCDCPAVSCDLNDPAKSRYFQAITATSSLLFHQDLLIDREIAGKMDHKIKTTKILRFTKLQKTLLNPGSVYYYLKTDRLTAGDGCMLRTGMGLFRSIVSR